MPGGSEAAWPLIKPIFQAIAAKVDDGTPCCEWVGQGGAGHFVKMVHNGIEYGDMQLICEAYQIMKVHLGMTPDEISGVFKKWNKGVLDSYLIEITGDILAYKDEDGSALVDKILDTAGQKGTGKWTSISALHEGVPLTLISEAVFARCLSALKDERVRASDILKGPSAGDAAKLTAEDKDGFIEDIMKALYASKIISYAQGFSLMRAASQTYGWDLDPGSIALLWRGGCIIRSKFLINIKEAFDENAQLENLMLNRFFENALSECQEGWRKVTATTILAGISAPTFSSALSYYDGYRSEKLPANLLQAQRDYFGAHTYERTDRPRGEFFHTNWTGEGGNTASSTYSV